VPLGNLTKAGAATLVAGAFAQQREASLTQLAAGALSTQIMTRAGAGLDVGGIVGGVPVVGPHAESADQPDALDRALSGHATDAEEDRS
jgi:hypothetical protein